MKSKYKDEFEALIEEMLNSSSDKKLYHDDIKDGTFEDIDIIKGISVLNDRNTLNNVDEIDIHEVTNAIKTYNRLSKILKDTRKTAEELLFHYKAVVSHKGARKPA